MSPSFSALLAYRERDRHASDHHRRPWTPSSSGGRSGARLLEADGREAFFMIPAPVNLARVFAAPLLGETRELFRGPAGLLARPLGAISPPELLDVGLAASELLRALHELPEREYTSALQSYSFLRTFVELAPAAELDRYARATIAALARRGALKEWRPPKPAREPSTKSRTDYLREQRARELSDARMVVSKWAPSLTPGRHELGHVWEAYLAALDAAPTRVRDQYPGAFVIGRRAFYGLLRERFEVVPGGGHRQLLVIPVTVRSPEEEEAPMNAIESTREYAAAQHEAAEAT